MQRKHIKKKEKLETLLLVSLYTNEGNLPHKQAVLNLNEVY